MNRDRKIGLLFIAIGLLAAPGFIVGHPYDWFILDIIILTACGGTSLYLLFHKSVPS